MGRRWYLVPCGSQLQESLLDVWWFEKQVTTRDGLLFEDFPNLFRIPAKNKGNGLESASDQAPEKLRPLSRPSGEDAQAGRQFVPVPFRSANAYRRRWLWNRDGDVAA